MDSGNSNSMQSSSGDDEYDSRAESISSFLNNNNNPSSYPPPPAPAPEQQHQLHHHPSLFDPLPSNYSFGPLSSSNPNSLLNLDMVWSKRLRSDQPNCTDLGGLFIPSTSLSFSSSPALPHIPRGGGGGGVITTESVSKSSSFSGPNNNNNNNNTLMARNPKKRSRASRRAPTTVLTTDTTNFRAMVQEFTGIPAPPFTSSSPFSRTRLDLFGTSSRSTPSAYSPSPSYNNLLRPFPQKLINPNPFTSSNSMIDSIASASTATTSYISNYQPLSSQNFLNINVQNNPILNLQSLLQLPPKYPLANSSILETKPPPTSQGSSLEELGLRHAPGTAAHLNTNLMSGLQSWPGTGAGAAAVGSNENREELGLFANGKLSNFSQVDNGQENVNVAAAAAATATRAEGMVESWICSSD